MIHKIWEKDNKEPKNKTNKDGEEVIFIGSSIREHTAKCYQEVYMTQYPIPVDGKQDPNFAASNLVKFVYLIKACHNNDFGRANLNGTACYIND